MMPLDSVIYTLQHILGALQGILEALVNFGTVNEGWPHFWEAAIVGLNSLHCLRIVQIQDSNEVASN